MSCPRLDDHLRSPQDPATAAALARHAEGCPECAQRRAALTRAQDILRSDVPPPMDPAAPARWLAAAETARAPRWGWLAATSLAAVAAIALGLVLRAPAPAVTVEGPHASLPPELGLDDGWLRLEPGAEARVSGLTLSVSAPLALQGLPERPLRVGYGAAEILVARAEAAPPLETPAGRIALGAGRFTVKVTGQQTLLTVKEGRARLTDARGATRTVEAGEQASLPFASASTAQPSLLNTGPTDHTSPDPARAPEAQRAPAWGEAPNAVVQDGHGPSAPNAVAQPGATSRGADAPSPHGPPGPAPRARAVDQPARDDDAPSPHSPPGAAPGAHAVADATSADSLPGPAPRAHAVDQPARADDAPRTGNCSPARSAPYAARTARRRGPRPRRRRNGAAPDRPRRRAGRGPRRGGARPAARRGHRGGGADGGGRCPAPPGPRRGGGALLSPRGRTPRWRGVP
ncbi:MAG: hypothetical protein H6730_33665 [Deltaproteobacteria bacterium]|nr:hypothetical protein [Deltaproteobacteria bacterium]